MLRRKSKFINSQGDSEATFELDLSPMLALMVTLIPIMLLATVFVKVTIVESKIPQLVKNAIEEDRKKKDRDVNIHLKMQKTGFNLQLKYDGKAIKTFRIPRKSEVEFDLDKLHTSLHAIKMMHPEIFRVDLFPDEGIPYEEIVKVMDEARTIKGELKKAPITDKETQKTVETDVMFPDVVFSNVVEG
jgi:biopolymer transport protein ExbD